MEEISEIQTRKRKEEEEEEDEDEEDDRLVIHSTPIKLNNVDVHDIEKQIKTDPILTDVEIL